MSRTLCNIKGCEKMAQKDGLCKAHLNGTEPRKSRLVRVVSPSVIDEPMAIPVVNKQESVEAVSYPEHTEQIIAPEELHTINLLQVVRDRLQADFDEEMTMIDRHLGLLTDPVEKLKYVYDRVWA